MTLRERLLKYRSDLVELHVDQQALEAQGFFTEAQYDRWDRMTSEELARTVKMLAGGIANETPPKSLEQILGARPAYTEEGTPANRETGADSTLSPPGKSLPLVPSLVRSEVEKEIVRSRKKRPGVPRTELAERLTHR